MKVLYLSLALFAVAFAGEPVVKESSHELALDGEAVTLESTNYPEDAPANLRQTWKLSTAEGNVIQVDCDDIRLFKEEPCGEWALSITDGEQKEELCTSVFDFSKKSSTNSLVLEMRTGGADRGFVHCEAKAIKA